MTSSHQEDREGFMEYVGKKSGNSYASGLTRIDQLYSVDLDGEYDKDKCDALMNTMKSKRIVSCLKKN